MSELNDGDGPQQIGDELKRVRQEAGLNQEQMAARLGVDYSPGGRGVSTGRASVSAWERNRRTPPPQVVQGYLDLGGDSQILAPLVSDTSPGPPVDEVPAADGAQEKAESVSVERGTTAGPARRRSLRWAWMGVGLATLVAVAVVVFAVVFRGVPKVATRSASSSSQPSSTWTETTGTPAHTWADPTQLTGAGTPLGPRQSIQVSCVVRGYVVQDGDPWWYRIESTPWDGKYYATSDAFYNNGTTSGNVNDGVVVDPQVPVC